MAARLRFASLVSACAVTVLGAACRGSSVDLPSDVLWSSEHFAYHTRNSEQDTCPDVLGPLEDHFAELSSYLAFAWSPGTKVDYYKFASTDDFTAHAGCPSDAGGCSKGTSVETTAALDEHELVHAYLSQTGFPPWVLVEGVAVALSCSSAFYPKPTLTYDQLASVPSGGTDDFTVYDVGAWLVGYLLRTFGPGAFMTLYGSLSNDADTAAIDAAFMRIYGQSLASVWADVLAEDRPRNVCIWECSRPPITADGTAYDTTGTCGVETKRPFTLPAEATISFSTTIAGMSIGPCGQQATPSGESAGGTPVLALYHLPAGQYFLSHDSVAGTVVGRADASATLNTDCASAIDPSPLAVPNVNAYAAVAGSTSPWFLALPPRDKGVLIAPFDTGGGATLCPSCGSSTCVDVTRQWTPFTGANDVAELATDPAKPFSEYTIIQD
jgi:hypothetical protein